MGWPGRHAGGRSSLPRRETIEVRGISPTWGRCVCAYGGFQAKHNRASGLGSRARGVLVLLFILFLTLGIISVAAAAQAVDLVMLVDESGSLCGKTPPGNVALEVEGLISALESVIVPRVRGGAEVKVAVVSFGTRVTLRLGLTSVKTEKDKIVAALRAVQASPECGQTNLGGAVNQAKAILDGGTALPGQRVINLVTDGEATVPFTGPESSFQNACAAARDAGYEIWALGIGKVNEASLIKCTGNAARYFYAPTVAGFVTVEQQKLRTILGRGAALDPDLWITKSAGSDVAKPGEELAWLLTVGNAGLVSESEALVSDPLPEGLTLVSVSPSQGRCQSNDNIIDCKLGRLPSGGRATITIITKVEATFSGTLTNTASVIGDSEDLNKSNNKATAMVRVSGSGSPNNPGSSAAEEVDPNAISAEFKADLLDAAADLLDLTHDLLNDVRKGLFESLVKVKDWKVEAQATLETCLRYQPAGGYAACATHAADLIQSADKEKTTVTFKGLTTVHDTLQDLEAEVADLIIGIEQATLEGEIGQAAAEALAKKTVKDEKGLDRPYAPLLVLMVFLSEKNIYLVEMDKLLEQANEYESEALAWLNTATTACGNNLDCQKKALKEALGPLKSSIKLIRQVEKYLWAIKDNIKIIKAWLCGFKQLVIRAPTFEPIEEAPGPICPWCLPPAVGLSTTELWAYPQSDTGAIRFVTLSKGVAALRVEVFTLAGAKVFDSSFVDGNTLLWPVVNGRGEPLANGIYLYIITLKSPSGELFRSEVRKIALLR